jgi:UDP-3-O-[3-hydroxymyristoyl] glucosamine N-acyltransferase
MKLSELAEQTGCRVEGDSDLEISGAAGLDEARPGHVTFLSNPRYTPRVKTTRTSVKPSKWIETMSRYCAQRILISLTLAR